MIGKETPRSVRGELFGERTVASLHAHATASASAELMTVFRCRMAGFLTDPVISPDAGDNGVLGGHLQVAMAT